MLAVSCSRLSATRDVQSSVCELATWGAAEDGRRVRLTAIFDTDGVENSVLRDESCPRVVVAPRDPPDESRDSSTSEAFDAVIYKPGLHRVKIDVSGVFRWRAGKTPPAALEMEKYWEIVELQD